MFFHHHSAKYCRGTHFSASYAHSYPGIARRRHRFAHGRGERSLRVAHGLCARRCLCSLRDGLPDHRPRDNRGPCLPCARRTRYYLHALKGIYQIL